MPDSVVIRVPKEEWAAQAEQIARTECARSNCGPVVAQSRWRWALTLPWRALRRMVASFWRRLTGTRVKE